MSHIPPPASDLLSPVLFPRAQVSMRNAVALAPLTNQQSHADGTLSEEELRFLQMRAQGGFGMVTTCAAHVALDGQGWPGELGIFDDSLLPGLTRLAGAITQAGALGIVQIFHGGMRSPSALIGQMPWSPSAWAPKFDSDEQTRGATDEDIERVIVQFGQAALRAAKAGFSGLEIHGAHGYLISQFLSTTYNSRQVGYGGSLRARALLLLEIVIAAQEATKAYPHFLVGVRLSPEDFGNARGIDLDETLQVAEWLAKARVDFLHVSLWNVFNNTKKRPEEHALPLFREAVGPNVRLLAAGSIWTREEAERVLALGADVVALGRSAIVNPDWPKRIADHEDVLRPPVSPEQLEARGVSPIFVNYLRRWRGFVG